MHSRRLNFGRGVLAFGIVLLIVAPAAALVREVFGTKRGKVYHTQSNDCASARKIQGDNRVTFQTEQEAKNAGRRICKRCETLDRQATGKSEPSKKSGGDHGDEGDGGAGGAGRNDRDAPLKSEPPTRITVNSELTAEVAKVNSVLPGGTLVLDNGEHATLVGVECPDRGQPGDKDAVRFLTEQTRGRTIRLAIEGGACRPDARDEHGRLCVYATPEPDGRDLGGELIFQGYAWVDRGAPFNRQTEYLRFEEDAWRGGRGVWVRGEGFDAGGESVVTGRHAHCYHPTSCAHSKMLANVMTLTLSEARARRLVPCSEFRGRK